jgi:hypothetical protein
MKKLTYTIIDANRHYRIVNIPLIEALTIGTRKIINGEEYHLYQSDYEFILPFLN